MRSVSTNARLLILLAAAFLAVPSTLRAQVTQPTTPPPSPAVVTDSESEGKTVGVYNVKQSAEFGGRIVDFSGSTAVWNTFVNQQSGPRLMNYDLQMIAPNNNGFLFDRLSTSSFGYGGDANDVSVLRMSKEKWYDFHASFRRDRNDWDYNLLANPLNPSTSNPAIAVTDSPHRFQTVRRIGSYNLTLAPTKPVTVRLGFSKNTSEGPSFSTFHGPTENLIFQNWRNDLRTYQVGVDVKLIPRTTISYDQYIAHHKGDTKWNDAAFAFQLSNGALVDLGVPFNTAANQPCGARLSAKSRLPHGRTANSNPSCVELV